MSETDTSQIPADELTGEALDHEAARLEIEGRSSMSADEKRAAVAAARDVSVEDEPVEDEPVEDDDEQPVQAGMESGQASMSHRATITPPITKN